MGVSGGDGGDLGRATAVPVPPPPPPYRVVPLPRGFATVEDHRIGGGSARRNKGLGLVAPPSTKLRLVPLPRGFATVEDQGVVGVSRHRLEGLGLLLPPPPASLVPLPRKRERMDVARAVPLVILSRLRGRCRR